MNADHVTRRACSLIRRLHGCTIGAVEFTGGWHKERVDAILFNSSESFLIETKISRQDFLADAKKPFRLDPSKGVGRYRYYACPEGLIKPEELPDRWGLIYVPEGRARCTMPVGYGGRGEKTGEVQNPGEYWKTPVHALYGSPFVGVDYRSREHPRNAFEFRERCLKREQAYLYALATRYKSQKFMENIL